MNNYSYKPVGSNHKTQHKTPNIFRAPRKDAQNTAKQKRSKRTIKGRPIEKANNPRS